MLQLLFFIVGLANSLFLIFIFAIRKNRLAFMQRIGRTYLLLAIPAAFGLYLVAQEPDAAQYGVFLGIFLTYLLLEWLFDFVLGVNFRERWRRNWKALAPYLGLYYAMNYGFVVMPWKTSTTWGLVMLGLFIVQIAANVRSHFPAD